MEDIVQISKLSVQLQSRISTKLEQMELDELQLKEERQKFEMEKELMQSLTATSSDIIKINVRGKIFQTRRSTLCQVEGCLLQYMFSGRWEDRLERDSENRVFLDYNPYCFGKILDFLWAVQVSGSEDPPPLPVIRTEDEDSFRLLARYLGLEEAVFFRSKHFSKVLKTADIEIYENGSRAVQKAGKDAYQSAFGTAVFSNEVVEITLKIEQLRNSYKWLMFGVVPDEYSITRNSHERIGSYGWSTNGNTWIAGKSTRSYKNFKSGILTEGSELMMTLDCRPRYNTLTLQVVGSTNKYQVSDLPRNQWRLQVVLYGSGDELRILNINRTSCQ